MKLCSRLLLLAALAALSSPTACPAQQFQFGWSISQSQGRGGSSAASQVVRATATHPGVQLRNAAATDQPGVYRLLDPSQPFLVLESSETSLSTTNSRSAGFSSFTAVGTSVFHTPVNP